MSAERDAVRPQRPDGASTIETVRVVDRMRFHHRVSPLETGLMADGHARMRAFARVDEGVPPPAPAENYCNGGVSKQRILYVVSHCWLPQVKILEFLALLILFLLLKMMAFCT